MTSKEDNTEKSTSDPLEHGFYVSETTGPTHSAHDEKPKSGRHTVTFDMEPPPEVPSSMKFHNLHSSLPPGMMFADLMDDSDLDDDDVCHNTEQMGEEKPHSFSRSSGRPDHTHSVIAKKKASMKFINSQRNITMQSNASTVSRDDGNGDGVQEKCEIEMKIDQNRGMTVLVESGAYHSFNMDVLLDETSKEVLLKESEYINGILKTVRKVLSASPRRGHQIEVRLKNFNFYVPTQAKSKSFVATVWNQSIFYATIEFFRRVERVVKYKRKKRARREQPSDRSTDSIRGLDDSERNHRRLFPKEYRKVLDDINVCLRPGNMYLLLGPPGSGKTSFLKAIAGLLPHGNESKRVEAGIRTATPYTGGTIQYNGLTMKNDVGFDFTNAISFVDQRDRHSPRLTVKETFDFAFQCRSGGTHRPYGLHKDTEVEEVIRKLDGEDWMVNVTLEGLGLTHVADTFVGDSDVRGVSGGQRRRVTVGEMMQSQTPIMCADEISNGLDAASTYDIIRNFLHLTKVMKRTRVVSLLQPSPETFGLFDEVILLSEGKLIYSGPTEDVVDYFQDLGYKLPARMDVADFLQAISTPDGAELFHPRNPDEQHYTPFQLAEKFINSRQGRLVEDALCSPHPYAWADLTQRGGGASDEEIGVKKRNSVEYTALQDLINEYRVPFRNSFMTSVWLTFKRQFTIWRRDKRFVIANFVKNVIMGVSVGAVFFQTDQVSSIFGVMFQGMLFIMLGAMTAAPAQIGDRIIYYKHADSNFYQTFAYVTGRFLALTPQSFLDVMTFGSILYWMVGLAPSAARFFVFIATLFVFNLAMNNMLGIFTSILETQAAVQGMSAFILLLSVLFSGFIVSPDVIPIYYTWLYWWNPLAWAYRALLVNEYTSPSPEYEQVYQFYGNLTLGDIVMMSRGFISPTGEPFTEIWVAYSFAYLVPYIVLCVFLVGLGLKLVRVDEYSDSAPVQDAERTSSIEDDEQEALDLPFTPVQLTFKDISYVVPASTGNEKLSLLKNISGKFGAGRMCALMGTSGAGKTTLMDVIALRKSTGTVTGEVRLNGFLQEKNAFRRCSGYVEQFDVQSPELTVRETIAFSAKLRLDPSIEAVRDEESRMNFVDSIIQNFDLTSLADAQVGGANGSGGLTFEQRKRLSIAVEFAASPSIIFLDEPTTGLDSRAAMIVMKSLKLVAQTGRTVIATVHQPSSAAFSMFDDLLLLRKGGEVVFHGALGDKSSNLIRYFENAGASKIEHGENPATWMLKILGDTSKDWGEIYRSSSDYAGLKESIEMTVENQNEQARVTFNSKYAQSFQQRNRLMNSRLTLIYWRSPAYNLGRVAISVVISFILGSVFLNHRHPEQYSETQMQSILSTIFIAFIILGVLSIITVLPVMQSIRDVFYRHRLAGMLGHGSLSLALGVAEKKYIILVSSLFVVIFYFTLGLSLDVRKFVAFWAFFTFNVAIYSYFGQAFMCLVPGMATAQILCSVFIGLNNFFSGLIVRPQYMTGLWSFTYWITPGHYVYEGLVASQFHDDTTPVVAFPGSGFFYSLNCTLGQENACIGTVQEYVNDFFGGKYVYDHIIMDGLVLGAFLAAARILTYVALKKFNYAYT